MLVLWASSHIEPVTNALPFRPKWVEKRHRLFVAEIIGPAPKARLSLYWVTARGLARAGSSVGRARDF